MAQETTGPDVLADVLAHNLRVVFCGTRASAVSAQRGAYYARPGNRFWPTLHRIGLTPRLFRPEQFADVAALGIGLTDLAKTSSGQDATMQPHELDIARFRTAMAHYAPAIIAFTSKTAAMAALDLPGRQVTFGRQAQALAGAEVFVLTSPSGLATRHWDIGPWQALAARIKDMDHHAAA